MYTHFVIHLSFLFRDEIGINFEFLKVTKARSPSDNRLKKHCGLDSLPQISCKQDWKILQFTLQRLMIFRSTQKWEKKTYIGCNLHMWRKFLISRH